MSESRNIERYTPQHPLPEEIKKMARDETVCHFCGVSYLIHSEIKKLEERLKSTEKELENYKGAVEREKQLISELDKLTAKKVKLESSLQIKESEISSYIVNLKCEKDLTEQLNKQKEEIIKQRDAFSQKCEKYHLIIQQLPAILKDVKLQKSDINDVRTFLKQREKQTEEELKTILTDFTAEYTKQQNYDENLQSKVQCLEMEKLMMSQSTMLLNNKLKSTETDNEKLKHLQSDHDQLTNKCKTLEDTILKFKEEMLALKTENKGGLLETRRYKDEIQNKKTELDNLAQQSMRKDQQTQDMINRLQNEIKEKESSLYKVHDDLKKLESRFHEQQRKEIEISEKSALTINESQQLREQLAKVKDETEALKVEREQMITSHQNRIEELRKGFKKKAAEADEWPEKMDEVLKNERIKHGNDLKLLEDKLKENFIMELQIEKEKYKELMSKYQSVNKDKESKWKDELSDIENKHRSDLTQLKQQFVDSKRSALEREEELQREINNLKDIIKDLENRLGKLDFGSTKDISGFKTQLRQANLELEDAISDMNKMAENVKNSKQEIQFLQDTVRKECEERFELTEALSDARQELLRLKKPAGGYASVTPRKSITTAIRSGSMSSILSQSDSGDINSTNISPSDISNKQKSLNNGSLNYQDVSKPSGNSSGSSLSQNRRRIANILGKKS